MLKPDEHPHPENEPEEGDSDGSASFEELMMLVFSGPMCFERPDENADAEDELESEGVGEGPESKGE